MSTDQGDPQLDRPHETKTVAWLIEDDGSAVPAVAVRPIVWPGHAEVTRADGTRTTAPLSRVRAADNLDLRWQRPHPSAQASP